MRFRGTIEAELSMASENVRLSGQHKCHSRIARDGIRLFRLRREALHGRTLGLHVLLRRVPVDAHFPGHTSNRQSPALCLLQAFHLVVWSGVGFLGGVATTLRTLIAPFSSTVSAASVVSIPASSAARVASQRLPRPLRSTRGVDPCEEERLKLLSMPGWGGASWLGMISPWYRTSS